MANIIFTNKCNLNCPFCFASENNLSSNEDEKKYDIFDSWIITNFLSSNTFRFCGGEPTLNKDIIRAFQALLINNKDIFIMTNGLWPNNFQDYIQNLPSQFIYRISYLFNVLEPAFYTKRQLEQLNFSLSIINPTQATIGITIYKKDFEYQYLLDFANQYNIKRIRWSIAAPNIQGNHYNLEKDFFSLSDKLHEFIISATDNGILTTRDCNFIPPCFFNKNNLLDIHLRSSVNYTQYSCSGSPIDIDVSGNAWRCYGMYSVLKANINNFKSEQELRAYFDRRMKILENLYPYKECPICPYWMKSCDGGCYAIRIKKALEKKPDICLFPIDDDNAILNCKPKKFESVVLKQQNNVMRIFYKINVLENPDDNVLSFLNEIDGKKTILDLIKLWSINFDSYEEAKVEIVKMFRELFELDIVGVKYDYGIVPDSIHTN